MKNEQMSIYDFIGTDELEFIKFKSQELSPSETVAQVDEAQELKRPSSALDTCTSAHTTNLEYCHECGIPTEDTDSTLFSVGDTVEVVNIYDKSHDDYDYLESKKGKLRVITSEVYITKGGKKHYNTVLIGEPVLPHNEVSFYVEELQKFKR